MICTPADVPSPFHGSEDADPNMGRALPCQIRLAGVGAIRPSARAPAWSVTVGVHVATAAISRLSVANSDR